MKELATLKKAHRGSDSSPESNSDSSSAGSNSGVARIAWVRVERMLTDFGHTADENIDGDTQSLHDLRYLDHASASEPSSPPAVKMEPTTVKSEGAQANAGTPSFTVINPQKTPNGNAVNGTPPKPTGGHAGVLVSTDYQPTYSNTEYDITYPAPSNGTQSYPAENMYPPVESQGRAALGPSMYNQQPLHMNTVPVPQPPMGAYHAVPASAQYPFRDFRQPEYATEFGTGNDAQFGWTEHLSFIYPYPVSGNGVQHQHQS
jgi:hypothetical protein